MFSSLIFFSALALSAATQKVIQIPVEKAVVYGAHPAEKYRDNDEGRFLAWNSS